VRHEPSPTRLYHGTVGEAVELLLEEWDAKRLLEIVQSKKRP
jgi:hypothetical protein